MAADSSDLDIILKPFYQRASEAEERLTRLEASLSGNNVSANKELPQLVKELRSAVEDANYKLAAEKQKASREIQMLTTENQKLQYRIIHLVQALKVADQK